MERTELRNLADEIVIENVIKNEGVFTTEDGRNLPFKYYKLVFTIGNNPMKFTAKVDKVFTPYVENE